LFAIVCSYGLFLSRSLLKSLSTKREAPQSTCHMSQHRQAPESSAGNPLGDSVLVICPAYNAAKGLPELIQRINAVCPTNDFVVVDDGSPDNSEELLRKSRVRYLRLPANRGKGAALKAGYDWARRHGYQSVLALDSDLQHAPEDIPNFKQKHRQAPEAVLLGCRKRRAGKMPLSRQLSNNLTSLLISILSDKRIRDSQCGFRLLPLSALRYAPAKSDRFLYESESLFMFGVCGADIREVPIRVIYNTSKSYINPLIVILQFIRLFWRRLWY